MKAIGQFINLKKAAPVSAFLDDKTIFFLFEKVIQEEYGNMGRANLRPDYYKNGKLFVKAVSSNWASELFQNRTRFIQKFNEELGREELREIKVN